jgi:STE24 endopeptidase
VQSYTLPPDKYLQAIAYAHARYALHFTSFAVAALALVAMIRLRVVDRLGNRRPVTIIGAILLLAAVADFPIDIIRHTVGLRYGISVQGWPSWLWDWSKGQMVSLAMGVAVILPFYVLLRKSPRRWWLYAWLAALPIMLVSVYADPLLFEPLFNKFEPLGRSHPELIPPIEKLLERAGVSIPVDHLFEMNASAKTNSLNAYVSGFGSSRRVVLYDTIIKKESGPALLTTFGHELGHYVLDHIENGMMFGAALLLIGLYLAYLVIRRARRNPAELTSLPVFLLIAEVTGFLSEPIVNAYSRRQEHAADVYSLEITHGIVPNASQAAAQAFQIEGETDLDEPDPNPLIVFWLYSHPPTAERLRFALEYEFETLHPTSGQPHPQ